MSQLSFRQKNNILYYFLISNLKPRKKIFEIINTDNRDTYIEAQEILGNYANDKNLKYERVKIESRDNAFHIFITNQELIYISYSNMKLYTSEQNFELFDEVNSYLINKAKERINAGQSFLIEDEKDEIKDIINKNIENVTLMRTLDANSGQTEKEILQVNSKEEDTIYNEGEETFQINNKNKNNENINIKKILKNNSKATQNELTDKILLDKDNDNDIVNKEKKNESSGEDIIKNKKINTSIPIGKSNKSNKSNNILIKNDTRVDIKNTRIKNLSKNTLISSLSKTKIKKIEDEKYFTKEKSKSIKASYGHGMNKNYSYSKYNYNSLNLSRNKSDCCRKEAILVILISIIVLQIAIIPLVIEFYDFSI